MRCFTRRDFAADSDTQQRAAHVRNKVNNIIGQKHAQTVHVEQQKSSHGTHVKELQCAPVFLFRWHYCYSSSALSKVQCTFTCSRGPKRLKEVKP
eukprot:6177386-Pleurochrysis_carterae.AAC.3